MVPFVSLATAMSSRPVAAEVADRQQPGDAADREHARHEAALPVVAQHDHVARAREGRGDVGPAVAVEVAGHEVGGVAAVERAGGQRRSRPPRRRAAGSAEPFAFATTRSGRPSRSKSSATARRGAGARGVGRAGRRARAPAAPASRLSPTSRSVRPSPVSSPASDRAGEAEALGGTEAEGAVAAADPQVRSPTPPGRAVRRRRGRRGARRFAPGGASTVAASAKPPVPSPQQRERRGGGAARERHVEPSVAVQRRPASSADPPGRPTRTGRAASSARLGAAEQ